MRVDKWIRCLFNILAFSVIVNVVYLHHGSLVTSCIKMEAWEGQSLPLLDNKKAEEKRVFTVFSTGCSPFQDWQSQTLIYNHRKLGIKGDVVRLMACDDPNYVLPNHSYEKYRVVRTPDFDVDFPDDKYSPRNRPGGLDYWLNWRSNDTDVPLDDDVLIMVDPDMVFLTNHIDVNNVTRGFGIGSLYGLGKNWPKDEFAQKSCNGKCKDLEDGYNPSFGHPMVLTAGDTRIHAPVWMNVTEQMRKLIKKWETDMFSNVISHILLDIQIDVLSTMLSYVDVESDEPWDIVQWNAEPRSPGVWVAHYCQTYTIGNFSWSKHDENPIDLRQCNRSMNFPEPKKEALVEMEHWRNFPLRSSATSSKEDVMRSRNVWMLDKTWDHARHAINAYYEEFC